MTGAEIAARLAEIRRACGATKTAVAEAAGCTRGTVGRWEDGDYPAALDVAAAWADRCGHDLALVPRAAGSAPSELADLVALLATAHVTEPDEKECE